MTDLGRRVLANVDADRGDWAEWVMAVSAEEYRDPSRFEREIDAAFRRSPIMVGG